MLMGEKSNETPAQSTQGCPKCGASLENAAGRGEPAPGTETCEVCGAPIVPLETSDRPGPQLLPPVPGPPPRGRNPLALVAAALVAAGMLYFGLHMARRNGAVHPLASAYGTPAPDFTLDTLDGTPLRLSSLRGKA